MLSRTIPTSSPSWLPPLPATSRRQVEKGRASWARKYHVCACKVTCCAICQLRTCYYLLPAWPVGSWTYSRLFINIFKDIQHFGDSCFDFTYLTTAYRCVIITARKYWLNQNPHGDRICSHLNYLVECTDSSSVGRHWSWRHYIRMNFVKTTYE